MDTPLAAYMTEAGIGDAEFASLIGRDRSFVNKLRRGVIRPTLDLAAAIEHLTKGAIPMQAWAFNDPGDPPPFPNSTLRTVDPAPGASATRETPKGVALSGTIARPAMSTSATTTCSTCSPKSSPVANDATRPNNDAPALCPACERASPADVVACTAVDCALRVREAA